MKRLPAVLLLTITALTGCTARAATAPTGATSPTTPAATCTPPAGGRCAADVPWRGPITVSADGRHLGGVVPCGGTLRATETDHQVTVRLHVGALGPGMMSCALVGVGAALDAPLGARTVVDAVSGRTLRVTSGRVPVAPHVAPLPGR